MKLPGKRAVITGGSTGIGLACAELFLAEGAERVVLVGRHEAALHGVRERLGGRIVPVCADVADLSEIGNLLATIEAQCAPVDILVVNAGIAEVCLFDEITPDQFDRLSNTNFRGALFTIQRIAPILSRGASVVLTSSASRQKGLPDNLIYSATKAALSSLVRGLTVAFGDREIRVNCVAAGIVDTPMLSKMGPSTAEMMSKFLLPMIPAGRFGRADEIAKAILFLASSDSSYVRGHELVVDGGWTAI